MQHERAGQSNGEAQGDPDNCIDLGIVDCPYVFGFERSNWQKNADRLVDAGLLARYRHGGFEITGAGRAAIAAPVQDDREGV